MQMQQKLQLNYHELCNFTYRNISFCILLAKANMSEASSLEFHANLKAYRNEILRVKQGHLANLLGISQSCLSNYENGRRAYPHDILEKMSELGNIPFPEFIALMYPHKNRQRLSPSFQILLAKEAQQYLIAGFFEEHRQMFENEPDLLDFIHLLSKLSRFDRTNLVIDCKKRILKLLQKD